MDALIRQNIFTAALTAALSFVSMCSIASDEFTPLFNGRDLSGWSTIGTPDSFTVIDGMIRTTGKHPYPTLLRSDKQYENFILHFSFRSEGWHEGGIRLHAPANGSATDMGFRIHLHHKPHNFGTHSMGAIYNVATPIAFPGKGPKKWNLFEVECNRPTLRIKLNGTLIHDINMNKDPAWRHRLHSGFIELENICNSPGFYKDIEIKTLPGKTEWIPLFASPDSITTSGGSKWTYNAAEQSFTASGRNSMAYTIQEFEPPYELQVWVKTVTANENGGIIFNMPKDAKHGHGVEIQCFNVPGATNPTGSIYGVAPAENVITRDGEWFLVQLFNRGSRATVYLNGTKISETDKLKPPYKGRIGFQQHTPGGKIIYRGAKIRTIELLAKPPRPCVVGG